jgi:flagellar protein FliS
VETGVPEADPHTLILMLFEGALAVLADARMKLMAGDIPGRGHAISKAIAIIEQGLRPSLDLEKGGEVAERMAGLYEYIVIALLKANLHKSKAGIEEAERLLSELHEGWKAIGTSRGGDHVRHAMPA